MLPWHGAEEGCSSLAEVEQVGGEELFRALHSSSSSFLRRNHRDQISSKYGSCGYCTTTTMQKRLSQSVRPSGKGEGEREQTDARAFLEGVLL